MRAIKSKILIILILTVKQYAEAQGFQNLDFESANISGYSPGSQNVPVSAALPGWTASFDSGTGPNVATQVWYDGISLGGAGISVIDTSAPIFSPLQGNYSAFLFGGAYGNTGLASSGISQSGLVPTGTESLLIDAYVSGASFIVTLGGQTINMTLLQGFSNYSLYAGNIPSSLAGEVATLSFTEPPATGIQPSMFELDNIQFSPSSVPEPSVFVLAALGALLLGFRHGNNKKATP